MNGKLVALRGFAPYPRILRFGAKMGKAGPGGPAHLGLRIGAQVGFPAEPYPLSGPVRAYTGLGLCWGAQTSQMC